MIGEDLSLFQGVMCVPARLADGIVKQVYLDAPDTEIFGGDQVAGEKVITYIVTDFPDLVANTAITVDGIALRVKGEPTKIDDGKWAKVGLKK